MCQTPIKIPNPNRGKDKTNILNALKDCTSQYIYVPCGTCPDCIALNQMYMVQRIQMEALKNELYMGTITYKNDMMPSIETSSGWRYRYADVKDLQNTIKRLREHNNFGIPFRSIQVSERGGKGGRPHFHILFLFKRENIGKDWRDFQNFEMQHKWDLFNEWKVNIGSDKHPIYKACSDYRTSVRNNVLRATYDFHWINPLLTDGGITDAAFYVLKYMLKGTPEENKIRQALFLNYNETEARNIWNTVKSKQKHSLGFGLNATVQGKAENRNLIFDEDIKEYLRQGIERSKKTSKYGLYYCPEKLMTFPLAPYYKEFGDIYTIEDATYFYYKNDGKNIDTIVDYDKEITQSIKKFNDYERKLKLLDQDVFSETLEELYL